MAAFSAGQILHASDLIRILPVFVIKAVDESVNNTGTGATLHNDGALFVSVSANITYKVDLHLIYTEATGTGIDLKAAWTFPSGCRLDLANVGAHQSWANAAAMEAEWAAWQNVTSSPSGTIAFGSSNAANFSMHARGTIQVGGTGGTLQLQWAQNTGAAGNLTVKAGSSLVLTPLLS